MFRASSSHGLLFALALALLAGQSHGRQGPAAQRELSTPPGSGGAVYEIDRRSHPALRDAWEELLRDGSLSAIDAALSPLAEGAILHRDVDWALIWLDASTKRRLVEAGVRLSEPRARPSAPLRSLPPGDAVSLRLDPLHQSLANAVSVDQMMDDLGAISIDIQTRYYNTSGMQAASQYALDRFVEFGLDEAYFDSFSYNGYSIRNVIGVKTGTLYPDRIYMICGHLDSRSPDPQNLAPGAEDNGSGSVGVLEAARLLAPLRTESTIYFVLFTAEEQGLVGSDHLAAIADAENWDLRGVLNMDMVGYDRAGAPDLWIEGFPSNPASVALMDRLEEVALLYTDMGVYRYPNDGFGSDHVPFDDHGFPAILAIDYDWDDYPCYHQTCDVLANIVPTQQRRMVLAVTVAGAQLAGLQADLGSIEGTADRTDSGDDSGIAIEILGTEYPPVFSGPQGDFVLPDLLPGTYTLRATAAWYEDSEVQALVVEGGVTHVTIPLAPVDPAALAGVVRLYGGGNPAGARVFVEGQQPVAMVAADGGYELEPVDPGAIVVSANFEGRMPSARTLEVSAGELVSGVDFDLKTILDFESGADDLVANTGWEWGSDATVGAHSGAKVWGTKLNANYDNCADYRLDLPPLDLRFYESARLRFWHWFNIEAAYDGGNVQVSTDGGATWAPVDPIGGYPGDLQGGCNPLDGQGGFGGAGASWREAVIDLASYLGASIRVRFWFGSDEGVRLRGWYIDDISLDGTLEPAGAPEGDWAAPAVLSSVEISPNPSPSAASIRFRLGATGETWATIFDAAGRRVRGLIDGERLGPGDRSLVWDGRDAAGRLAPAGVYWLRVFVNGRSETRPLTLVR